MSDSLYALSLNGNAKLNYQYKDLFNRKTAEEERKENEEKAKSIISNFLNKCKEYE